MYISVDSAAYGFGHALTCWRSIMSWPLQRPERSWDVHIVPRHRFRQRQAQTLCFTKLSQKCPLYSCPCSVLAKVSWQRL